MPERGGQSIHVDLLDLRHTSPSDRAMELQIENSLSHRLFRPSGTGGWDIKSRYSSSVPLFVSQEQLLPPKTNIRSKSDDSNLTLISHLDFSPLILYQVSYLSYRCNQHADRALESCNRQNASYHYLPANFGPQCPCQSNHQQPW